jgi:hypothetical protein
MLNRNPLTEDEHTRVSTLMREIDDLSKRGRQYASTGGTDPNVLRKAARAYNDRVAVLRVLIGNRPVEQLEQKWLYGPTAWSMVVGQEWDLVVRPRERARASIACNPKRRRGVRRNTDIAGAMIAGASAAIVGKMIRGNPGARKNFRHARIHRLPKPGECEIGLISQDNCYRKATVDVEMGLKRGTPLRVCQRHADWIKRMKGNPRGIRRNPGDRERLEAQAQRVRLWEKLYSQYTEKLRRLDDLKKAGRYGYQLRMPLKALKIAADKLKEVFPEETKRMSLNPTSRKRYSPPRDRANMFEVFWMSGKQAWHAGPFFGRPGAEKYVERYKAGWKGTWPLHYCIMSYKQWGESGAPTSAPEWMRAWRLNPCGSRKNPITRTVRGRVAKFCGVSCAEGFKSDREHGMIYPSIKEASGKLISVEEASRKYKFCAYCSTGFISGERAIYPNPRSKHRPSVRHCTSCGTPLKRGETLMCAFCRREGSYSFNKKNPLASGAWKGWSIKPGGRGFVRRFGKRVVVYIYLNRGGRAPNIWTWRVHLDGKRRYGGDVATDEIARRRVMAVMYGTHKNPDSDMTGTMIVQCCICKKTMGTKPCLPEHHGKISHTYCPSCLAAEKEKIRLWRERWKAARARGNPPSKKEMAMWPKCVTCGKPAGWSVDWLLPSRIPDTRPCCSMKCAIAIKKKEGKA